MKVDKNRFVQEVTNVMIQRGWNQTDLAKAIGRTTSTVSYWLSGKRAPSVGAVLDISKSLGLDPNIMFAEGAGREGEASGNILGRYDYDLSLNYDSSEEVLLELYRNLNPERKGAVLKYAMMQFGGNQ